MREIVQPRLAESSLSAASLPRARQPAAPHAPSVPDSLLVQPLLFPFAPRARFFPLRSEPNREAASFWLADRACLPLVSSLSPRPGRPAFVRFPFSGARRLRAPARLPRSSPISRPLARGNKDRPTSLPRMLFQKKRWQNSASEICNQLASPPPR